MYWELYALILLLSAGACAVLWTRRPTRPVFGYAGTAGWAIVSLQARNIEIYHQDGTSTVVGSEAFQYVAAAMAVLSAATLMLWYLGVYPPVQSEDAGTAEIPD